MLAHQPTLFEVVECHACFKQIVIITFKSQVPTEKLDLELNL